MHPEDSLKCHGMKIARRISDGSNCSVYMYDDLNQAFASRWETGIRNLTIMNQKLSRIIRRW